MATQLIERKTESLSDNKMETKRTSFKVTGMSCASCVNTIEKALRNVNGVISANVNFASETATVEFISDIVTVASLRNAVQEVGYGVAEEAKAAKEGSKQVDVVDRREIQTLRAKTLFSLAMGIVIFIGSFPQWFPWMPGILNN